MFVLITLSVGMAARGGREMLLTACHGAIAFTVAADTPALKACVAEEIFPSLEVWPSALCHSSLGQRRADCVIQPRFCRN